MNNFKKPMVAGAIATALGLTATNAGAVGVASITLGDIDDDGDVSGFRFTTVFNTSFPTGTPGTFPNDLTFGGANDDCGGGPGSCSDMVFGGPVGTDVFTSGFNFGGGGDFSPVITGTTAADVSGGVLDLTALDFAGVYNGTTFFLEPQDLGDVTAYPVMWISLSSPPMAHSQVVVQPVLIITWTPGLIMAMAPTALSLSGLL